MWSDLKYRLRALFRRDAMERELADELRFHLDREQEARGSAARAQFGGVEQTKEACRDERGTGGFDRFRQDLSYAWRMFVRQPSFTSAVVATLALGIGGATTMFAVVDGVLVKPLPYPDADRIVRIGRSFGGVRVGAVSPADYVTLSSRARTLTSVAVTRTEDLDISVDGSPQRVRAATVSASYFDLLGGRPARGQAFGAGDDKAGARQIAVISDALARRTLGSVEAVGRSILVAGQPHVVVGVMPRRFHGPEALDEQSVELWLPLGRRETSADPDDASLGTLALLAPGASSDAATRELSALAGANHFWTTPLKTETVGDSGLGLWLLFGAVSLLLILAGANVANLFLVRATDRGREIAVRSALGAGRGRIARQLVTETLFFALSGGVAGASLAYGGVELVRQWAPTGLPRVAELQVDVRVLLFAFGISSAAGILFGLSPAHGARRADLTTALRGTSAAMTAGRLQMSLRNSLVVLQTAIAMMLVVGAALLGTSVIRLSHVDAGFDPTNVVWMDVTLPERSYAGGPAKADFFENLTARANAIAGVEAIGVIQGRPLGGGNAVASVAAEGRLPGAGHEVPRVPFHVISPGYFDALHIARIDGRDFGSSDRATSPRVAVVSRSFANQFWPGERAVGRRFWMGRVAADAPLTEVIGVVEDVRQYALGSTPVPMVYRALTQVPRGAATLVARHDGSAPFALIERLREAAWAIDSALPLERSGTMDAAVASSIREPRFRAIAFSSFGAIACAIACVGLAGSLAWLARARRRELGIRVALGANAASVRSIIVRRGMTLAAVGVAIGLAGAAATTRYLGAMVYGISTTDLPTFIAAAIGLLAIAFAASHFPARKASSVSAIEILRD